MTERYDKFTERARKTLQLAQEEAQRFNHNYIGTEHILLGLVREGDGVAAHVLHSLGIELNKVRTSVEFIIGRGDRMVMGEIGLTPRAKRVIELAVDEARRLNHHYIGTEHLLLGLVREGEGIAAGVLESLGVSLGQVRAATKEVLRAGETDIGQSGAGQLTADWPEMDRFDRFTRRARETLKLAQEEAQRLGHNYIGPEHILLALVRVNDGVAARVLQNLRVEPNKVRAAVEFLLFGSDQPPARDPNANATGEIGLSAAGKRVLELAVDESRRLRHHYVGTEHLLLGLAREGEGIAAGVLESLGVSLDKVRLEVIEVLSSSSGYSSASSGENAQRRTPPYPDFEEVIALKRGRRWRAPFFTGEPEEARSLRKWVDAELDFHILKHVDNSFLDVLRDAVPVSLLLERSYIGADHFLTAMLRDENSVASRLLREHQADLDQIYTILERGTGERWANPFTYEAMRAIRIAIDDARALGVKATATHLLLGIMLEGGNTAYFALTNAGVTAGEVRALLSGGSAPASE